MVDRVIAAAPQPRDGAAREFQGHRYGEDVGVSFLLDVRSGGGPRLHRHPYEEVIVVQEGVATFTLGGTTVEVSGGHDGDGVPHKKFVNSGDGPLRQVDIHRSGRVVTEWLEG
jgi:mannose-6-phosphate isomerase-like protein (cupin superfamily)